MGKNQLKVFWKCMLCVVSFFWSWCFFTNLNFIAIFLAVLPQQEVLVESIRIFIYQTEQTYVKQTWYLSSFEVV